jgi:NuA3 HAT complex component NTO1
MIFARALAASGHPGNPSDADIEAIHTQLNEVKPGTAEHLALSQEQKDLKRLAKRIVKAVKEPLEEAMKKEAELRGIELEEQLRKLDSMGIFASAATKSLDADGEDEMEATNAHRRSGSDTSAVAGASPEEPADHRDTDMPDADAEDVPEAAVDSCETADKMDATHEKPSNAASGAASYASSTADPASRPRSDKAPELLSPPASRSSFGINGHGAPASASGESSGSSGDPHDVLAHGGVPWYLVPFDPIGTTIHEERYTGRAVLREMSEELSDMDEDTLTELAPISTEATSSVVLGNGGGASAASTASGAASARKPSSRKKRPRRSHWSR